MSASLIFADFENVMLMSFLNICHLFHLRWFYLSFLNYSFFLFFWKVVGNFVNRYDLLDFIILLIESLYLAPFDGNPYQKAAENWNRSELSPHRHEGVYAPEPFRIAIHKHTSKMHQLPWISNTEYLSLSEWSKSLVINF